VIIFIAGPYTSELMPGGLKDREEFRYKLAKKWIPDDLNVLESYHYIGKHARHINTITKDKKKIFLDSGAFSMFTQGITVDLRQYADFIIKHKKAIFVASNLDVIGKGNEKGSWKNQQELEKMGAKVAPVHHARDADKWLVRYIDAGYDYIFLGGMVPESTTYLRGWLDRIWGNILTDKDGFPKVKIHGFGLTTPELMLRYPWYSVDSTSWIMAAASGSIYFPMGNRLRTISISDLAPAAKKRGSHYNTISGIERKAINYWVEKFGFKPKNFQGRQYGRSTWNIMMFHWLQNNVQWPTHFKNNKGLFDDQGF
jgi:hypothetical protein